MNSKDVKYIVVHCAYTPPAMDVSASDIDRWHREKGWLMIGYHAVIKRDGTLEKGRPLNKVGAHVRGINSKSVGICLAGGMMASQPTPEFNYTEEQMIVLRETIDDWLKAFPHARVAGHTDFDKKKTCPNFDARLWYETGKIVHTY